MATVRDKSTNAPFQPDYMLNGVSSTVTSTPQAVKTPDFVGQLVYDRGNDKLYRAYGAANTQWELIVRE